MTHFTLQEVFTSDMDEPHYEIHISTENTNIYEETVKWFKFALSESEEKVIVDGQKR